MKFKKNFCKTTTDHEFNGVVYEATYICTPEYERIDKLEASRFSSIFGGNLINKITSTIKTMLSNKINQMFDCEDYRPTIYYLA